MGLRWISRLYEVFAEAPVGVTNDVNGTVLPVSLPATLKRTIVHVTAAHQEDPVGVPFSLRIPCWGVALIGNWDGVTVPAVNPPGYPDQGWLCTGGITWSSISDCHDYPDPALGSPVINRRVYVGNDKADSEAQRQITVAYPGIHVSLYNNNPWPLYFNAYIRMLIHEA
jgi:hypothetical protein